MSVDAEFLAAAQVAVARGEAESVSAWVNDALRLKGDHDRRLRALGEFLASYEVEHGEITEKEMHDAARRARARAVVVRGGPDSTTNRSGSSRSSGTSGSASGGLGAA